MAIYMGLVVTKQWEDGNAIYVDDHTKMANSADISLVTDKEILIELP